MKTANFPARQQIRRTKALEQIDSRIADSNPKHGMQIERAKQEREIILSRLTNDSRAIRTKKSRASRVRN
jgi:hypothetical protein